MKRCGENRVRFVADEMLGSLAKWLRIMGYDTLYEKDVGDDRLAEMASLQDRALLTRDKHLAQRTEGQSIYIVSDDLRLQLTQVITAFSIDLAGLGTRCALCNGVLSDVTKEEVAEEVPPRSLQMTDSFYRCTGCGKVYWKGTHWKNIQERLRELGVDQARS